ncbi:hypothetical protein E4U54_007059, partial [Claviceps lovelessii]
MFGRSKKESTDTQVQETPVLEEAPLDLGTTSKTFFEAALPVFACGAGLFSDGYINN